MAKPLPEFMNFLLQQLSPMASVRARATFGSRASAAQAYEKNVKTAVHFFDRDPFMVHLASGLIVNNTKEFQ